MWSDKDKYEIASKLKDTVLWCNQHPFYAAPYDTITELNFESWHSDILHPKSLTSEQEGLLHYSVTDQHSALIVEEVCKRRANFINTHPSILHFPIAGTLFAYASGYSDVSGPAGPETDDYFDETDAPPWDVWLTLKVNHKLNESYFQNRQSCDVFWLLFWVPEHLLDMVYQGVSVMPFFPIIRAGEDELFRFIDRMFKLWHMPTIKWSK